MSRREFSIEYGTEDGARVMRVIDRITVDDVFLHMVRKELYRLMTGVDEGDEVNREFKDFLIRERHFVG